VKSYFLSFQQQKIFYAKISDYELKKAKMWYNPSKFESWTSGDFKFIVLWTLLNKRFSSVSAVLKHLSETPQKELRKQLYNKEDLLVYQNVFKKDKKAVEGLVLSTDLVIQMYKKGKISFLFAYYYLHNKPIKGRIKQSLWKRLKMFVSYFPKIKEYLEKG
jgi:hypothetical protein